MPLPLAHSSQSPCLGCGSTERYHGAAIASADAVLAACRVVQVLFLAPPSEYGTRCLVSAMHPVLGDVVLAVPTDQLVAGDDSLCPIVLEVAA